MHRPIKMCFILVMFQAAAGMLAGETQAAPGCAILISQIGPTTVRSEDVVSYLFRIENPVNCSQRNVKVTVDMPEFVRFRRAYPPQSSVQLREIPKGPLVIWNEVELPPGEVALIEVGLHFQTPPNRSVRTRLCAKVIDFWDPEFCRDFRVQVMP